MKHDVICKLCNTMYSLFYDNKILVKPLIETQEKKGGGNMSAILWQGMPCHI